MARLSHKLGLYSHTPGWAELCRELFEDRGFSGSDWTTYIKTNDEFENKLTEYLTANNMSIYDLLALLKNNLVTETLTNDLSYEQTINSTTNAFTIIQHRSDDTTMDNYYMANYPQDIDWSGIMPVDPEMSTEPAPFNTDDDNFDDEVENSSTTGFNDPSSDVNPAGERQPGYRWCCGKWKKDDGNFKRHLDIHNKQVPCEAEPLFCHELFADKKARNRHYKAHHKKYAKEHAKELNIRNEKCFCEPCKTSLSRLEYLRRHIKNRHSKESEVNEGERVIDDKHEMVEGDGEEYAWVCRLKDTE